MELAIIAAAIAVVVTAIAPEVFVTTRNCEYYRLILAN